jgi:hypothetical protein
MKYMLLIYSAESCWSDGEREACMRKSMRVCEELMQAGKYIIAAPLQFVTTAQTLRVREGQTLITDGPFAETTEQLGGFYLLELDNLDEAIAIASQLPPVLKGTVEIRPLQPLEGVPPMQPMPEQPGERVPYLLMCYDDEAAWRERGEAALRQAQAEAARLTRELHDRGQFVTASPLRPAATATCVRLRDGKRLITDGPFSETHEVLGGFYVFLAESPTEAARIAARHPGARIGCAEVRPLFDTAAIREQVAAS